MKAVFVFLIYCLAGGAAKAVDTPPLASQEAIEEAVSVFTDWARAWESKDYNAQWALTHPRIQRWHHIRRWRDTMRKGRARSGDLTAFEVTNVAPVHATQIPCTEQGHCYRKDMQVVLILLKTGYARVDAKQPEYVIMANSEEGWRFGGGTFPALPLGETMVILDRKDERRYEQMLNKPR
ncbi:MAG: hypothetical protein HWE25_02330 [Alphaproteobacteria bacterium]|nr:hypothetical protein [Alphaproteobacteria bacterium]